MIQFFIAQLEFFAAGRLQYLTVSTFKILIVTVGVILCVAYSTYFERKVIGSMQARVGPNRVGLPWPVAAVRRRLQAAVQGSDRPRRVEPLPVHHRAVAVTDSGARDLGRDTDERHLRHRGHQCRPVIRARTDVGRRLWRNPGGLGHELEVRVPRRDAFRGTDRRLRDRDGLRAGRRPDGSRQPEPRRHRRERSPADSRTGS